MESLNKMNKKEIQEDLNKAVKNKDSVVLSTLRMLLAAISNEEKEKKYKQENDQLTQEELLDVVSAEAKKRKEAIASYQEAGRKEQAERERAELEILQKYLPEQLSKEEIESIIKKAIEETSANSEKDIGKVMGAVMPKIKGKADGAKASQIAKELLS